MILQNLVLPKIIKSINNKAKGFLVRRGFSSAVLRGSPDSSISDFISRTHYFLRFE